MCAGESLGSVVAGDTVLFQSPSAPPPSPCTSSDGGRSFVTVTSSFPYFKSWIQSGREADFAVAFEEVLNSEFMVQGPVRLGREIATGDSAAGGLGVAKAQLILECDEVPLLQGRMRLFTGVRAID